MKRVVVTGGSGRLGTHVIRDLVAAGYEVLSIDLCRPKQPSCRFAEVDLTDAASVFDAFSEMDAVIHLGAVPGPVSKPSSVTFRNNVLSTFNVAQAVEALGLQKLVFASSVFTLGWHEDAGVFWPQKVPVTEEHPLSPFEAYGLSKVVGEETVAAMSRRSAIPSVSLRIMNVIQTDGYFAMPWPAPSEQQPVRFVLWPYVDVRDAARACRMSLEAQINGHEAFFIAAEDTRFDVPTRSLLQQFAPQVAVEGELPNNTTVVSIEKARRVLGFYPEFSWRTFRSAENS